jgi:transcriptional antiterminator NusG
MINKWYTIKVQFNKEKSVKSKIELEAERNNIRVNIIIPFEKTFFVREGKRLNRDKILYPGYIFIETDSIGEIEYLLKSIPGNTGIIKDKSGNIQHMREHEINNILTNYQTEMEKDKVEFYKFIKGEEIQISDSVTCTNKNYLWKLPTYLIIILNRDDIFSQDFNQNKNKLIDYIKNDIFLFCETSCCVK